MKPDKTLVAAHERSTSPATAILALDLGATTGWAMMGPRGLISGVWKIGVGITDMGIRCESFRTRLTVLTHMCGGLQAIYFEEVNFIPNTRAKTMRAYGGYEAVVSMFALSKKIPLIGVGVTKIKKHATAKGNATKDMIKSAVKLWNVVDTIIDDNHADALALLDYALISDYDGSINHYQRMVRYEKNKH